jgi:hypothetical protein
MGMRHAHLASIAIVLLSACAIDDGEEAIGGDGGDLASEESYQARTTPRSMRSLPS